MLKLHRLHIATLPNGKHLLIGSLKDAQVFMDTPTYRSSTLDSDTLSGDHAVSVSWLAENNIQKVIDL